MKKKITRAFSGVIASNFGYLTLKIIHSLTFFSVPSLHVNYDVILKVISSEKCMPCRSTASHLRVVTFSVFANAMNANMYVPSNR